MSGSSASAVAEAGDIAQTSSDAVPKVPVESSEGVPAVPEGNPNRPASGKSAPGQHHPTGMGTIAEAEVEVEEHSVHSNGHNAQPKTNDGASADQEYGQPLRDAAHRESQARSDARRSQELARGVERNRHQASRDPDAIERASPVLPETKREADVVVERHDQDASQSTGPAGRRASRNLERQDLPATQGIELQNVQASHSANPGSQPDPEIQRLFPDGWVYGWNSRDTRKHRSVCTLWRIFYCACVRLTQQQRSCPLGPGQSRSHGLHTACLDLQLAGSMEGLEESVLGHLLLGVTKILGPRSWLACCLVLYVDGWSSMYV